MKWQRKCQFRHLNFFTKRSYGVHLHNRSVIDMRAVFLVKNNMIYITFTKSLHIIFLRLMIVFLEIHVHSYEVWIWYVTVIAKRHLFSFVSLDNGVIRKCVFGHACLLVVHVFVDCTLPVEGFGDWRLKQWVIWGNFDEGSSEIQF